MQVWKELRRLEMKELQVGAQCMSPGPTGGREPAASVRTVVLPEGAMGTLGGGGDLTGFGPSVPLQQTEGSRTATREPRSNTSRRLATGQVAEEQREVVGACTHQMKAEPTGPEGKSDAACKTKEKSEGPLFHLRPQCDRGSIPHPHLAPQPCEGGNQFLCCSLLQTQE